jgi:hypothetical protein
MPTSDCWIGMPIDFWLAERLSYSMIPAPFVACDLLWSNGSFM